MTFPRNFDRVVGLMGRKDIVQPPLDTEESKKRNGARKDTSNTGVGNDGNPTTPPWTKYLLEEGLERTKAFSRYKGVFAGETVDMVGKRIRGTGAAPLAQFQGARDDS